MKLRMGRWRCREQTAEVNELTRWHPGCRPAAECSAAVHLLRLLAAAEAADHQRRINPAAREVHAIEHCPAVFGRALAGLLRKFERQGRCRTNSSPGDPQARLDLIRQRVMKCCEWSCESGKCPPSCDSASSGSQTRNSPPVPGDHTCPNHVGITGEAGKPCQLGTSNFASAP